jgi:hypothetical protein
VSDIATAIEGLERQKQLKLVEVAKLDEALKTLRGLEGSVEPSMAPRSEEYRGLGIADAAKRWLRENGGTHSTREIADALLARGLSTNSKNYTATVYAVLAALKHQFKRTREGWALKEGEHS